MLINTDRLYNHSENGLRAHSGCGNKWLTTGQWNGQQHERHGTQRTTVAGELLGVIGGDGKGGLGINFFNTNTPSFQGKVFVKITVICFKFTLTVILIILIKL